MGLAAVGLVDQSDIRHPLQVWWLILWPSMFAIHLYLLPCMDSVWNEAVALTWHVAGALLALGCMIAANRFRQRVVWFTGAGLLTVVVVKLFVVDLSESGRVSRIVSFLAVGGLMLVIGFVTPLPPAESKGAGA
jgi:hypothetical protein